MVELAVGWYSKMADNDVFNLMIAFEQVDVVDDRWALDERAFFIIVITDLWRLMMGHTEGGPFPHIYYPHC